MSLGKRLITTGEAVSITATDHFNTVLYTGNSSDQSITGVGFQPDLVWIKRRNTTEDHALFDSVRGTLNQISSNLTAAAYDTASPNEGVKSFDSDGFTTGNNGATNRSPNTYVAWNWKAGGSAVSNSNGSITSSVSANTAAGFSIVKYTGTGSAATIGHGLNSSPELIFVKTLDSVDNWMVLSTAAGATKKGSLNARNEFDTDSAPWNDTAPTSTVFTVGTKDGTNKSGDEFIAYCFHSVATFQDIGLYSGSSSTVTVTTGFEPRFVIIKRIDVFGNDWIQYDQARSGGTNMNDYLVPNDTIQEITNSAIDIDATSTGFTVESGNWVGINASGGSYLYWAIA